MRGGAFLNGKEGRVGFRKKVFPCRRDGEVEKKPFLMGKSNANECNESSLSNCRVQLTLSTKKNGMILEERYSNEEPNITFFKILIGITTCNIVVTL